jgi:hypothetical protein
MKIRWNRIRHHFTDRIKDTALMEQYMEAKLSILKENFLKSVNIFVENHRVIELLSQSKNFKCDYNVFRNHVYNILSILLCEHVLNPYEKTSQLHAGVCTSRASSCNASRENGNILVFEGTNENSRKSCDTKTFVENIYGCKNKYIHLHGDTEEDLQYANAKTYESNCDTQPPRDLMYITLAPLGEVVFRNCFSLHHAIKFLQCLLLQLTALDSNMLERHDLAQSVNKVAIRARLRDIINSTWKKRFVANAVIDLDEIYQKTCEKREDFPFKRAEL